MNNPIISDGRTLSISTKYKAEAFETMFSQKYQVIDQTRLPPKISTIIEDILQSI